MTIVNTNQPYVNDDGLAHKFPPLNTVKGIGGEIGGIHETRMLSFSFDYTFFTTGNSEAPDADTTVKVVDWNLWLPAGAIIEDIHILVGTAWTSAADGFLLDLGTVKKSDFETIIDADGLLASVPEAAVLDGENSKVRVNGEHETTYVGALLNDVGGIAEDSLLSMSYGGEAPTAGTATIRIYWR